MELNITHTLGSFQFENRENLRNSAKEILKRQNSSNETSSKIIDKTIFDTDRTFYPAA